MQPMNRLNRIVSHLQFHPTDASNPKPIARPNCPNFSSGPCAKRPGWTIDVLKNSMVGRSHRSANARKELREVIESIRELLHIPKDFKIGIMPASDTGAVEAVLWSMIGARPVETVVCDAFSKTWHDDIVQQLKIKPKLHYSPYGQLTDMSKVNQDNDVVFVWNGTTAGVRVPNGDWIRKDRKGLLICDATSAVFAMDIPVKDLDVLTFSWQKALGGEAAHGILVMSPRAVERLETFKSGRPLPKIFRMTKAGKLDPAIWRGDVINTVSMLCVTDVLDALNWAKSVGGLQGMIARAQANYQVMKQWVDKSDWIKFLPEDESIHSCTSMCFSVKHPKFTCLDKKKQVQLLAKLRGLLDKERVAYDINSYGAAPAGLRVWGGCTVEASDLMALTPWLDWAWREILKTL